MKSRGIILLAMGALAAVAGAQTVQIESSKGNYGATAKWTLDGDTHESWVGQIDLKIKDGATISGYCVDAKHTAKDGYQSYYVKTTDDLNAEETGANKKIGYLLNTYAPGIHTDKDAMAMQLAIWELLYDAMPYNVGTGQGQFSLKSISGYSDQQTQAVIDKANQLAGTDGNGTATYFKSKKSHNQSFAAPVPEPASLAVLGVGALALLRRRKNRR